MSTADRTVLEAGASLSLRALVSPDGAYALEHRPDGTLVLRDRRAGRDVWGVGAPDTEPGRLVLLPDGRLVLEARSGAPVWVSGDADRRAAVAAVTDQGRLVLRDLDGGLRWSRDPLTDADLAAHRPATGDRLLPGQVLVEPLVSPDGRYLLTRTSDGETMLTTQENGRTRRVWSCPAPKAGALTLGADGVLRAGTDATVLLRWTGRYRLDPAAVRISAVVVRDRGDVVLLDDTGAEFHDSRTADEEARYARLLKAEARRLAKEAAKPPRPGDGALPRDWFDLLDLQGPSTLTLMEHGNAAEALQRLGAAPGTIRPMTYRELEKASFDLPELPKSAWAVALGDRVMLVEPCGLQGVDRAAELSRGGSAVVRHLDHDGWELLAWYRDGQLLAQYGEDDADRLARGARALRGAQRDAFTPFMAEIGLGVYRADEDGPFLPPSVELACLAAGVRPGVHDLEGSHPGAVFGTW